MLHRRPKASNYIKEPSSSTELCKNQALSKTRRGFSLPPRLERSPLHLPIARKMNKPFRSVHNTRVGASEHLDGFRSINAGVRQKAAQSLQQTIRCRAAAIVEDAPKAHTNEFQTAAKEMPAPRGGKLKEKATAYIEEHRIRAYEADPNQRTTIVTMSNLLQVDFTRLEFSSTFLSTGSFTDETTELASAS